MSDSGDGSAADAAPLCCPTCAEDLRAGPDAHAPVLLQPCGHSLCGLCADAVAHPPPPSPASCPICCALISSNTPNAALGELAEALHSRLGTECAGALPCGDCVRERAEGVDIPVLPATHLCSTCSKAMCDDHRPPHNRLVAAGHVVESVGPTTRCPLHPSLELDMMCVTDEQLLCAKCALVTHSDHPLWELADAAPSLTLQLQDARSACVAGAQAADANAEAVLRSVEELRASTAECMSRFHAEIAELKAALDRCGEEYAGRCMAVCAQREKALEAQNTMLTVSASQLRAAVSVCDAALAARAPIQLLTACTTVKRMSAVSTPFSIAASPDVGVTCDLTQVAAAARSLAVVGSSEVGAGSPVSSRNPPPPHAAHIRAEVALRTGERDDLSPLSLRQSIHASRSRVLPAIPSRPPPSNASPASISGSGGSSSSGDRELNNILCPCAECGDISHSSGECPHAYDDDDEW